MTFLDDFQTAVSIGSQKPVYDETKFGMRTIPSHLDYRWPMSVGFCGEIHMQFEPHITLINVYFFTYGAIPNRKTVKNAFYGKKYEKNMKKY